MSSKENDTKDSQSQNENQESDGASMSSWFSGWYDSAKKKLAETNEFMKHDLQEFSQSVQDDASRLVAVTATTMKEKLNINVDLDEASSATRAVKDSLSNFLGNIANKVGPIRPEDNENDEESAIVGTSSGTKVLSPSQARLFAIQTDPATFCNEPDNEEQFYSWLPGFNVEKKNEEISTLMLDVSQVRSLYTKLVPSAVSHSDFWARYYFKIYQHEKAEERRALLVERAHQTHNDIEWDDEDDDWVQPRNVLPGKAVAVDEPTDKVLMTKDNLESEEITGSKEFVNVVAPEKLIEPENAQEMTDISLECSEREEFSDGKRLKQDEPSETIKPVFTEKSTADDDHAKQNSNVVPDATRTVKDSPFDQNKTDMTSQDTKTVENITSSSGEISDDWEKDFDLDMTEDEIQQALKESDAINAEDIGEDWDEWE